MKVRDQYSFYVRADTKGSQQYGYVNPNVVPTSVRKSYVQKLTTYLLSLKNRMMEKVEEPYQADQLASPEDDFLALAMQQDKGHQWVYDLMKQKRPRVTATKAVLVPKAPGISLPKEDLMKRAPVEPQPTLEPKPKRVKLVEISSDGEPDSDPATIYLDELANALLEGCKLYSPIEVDDQSSPYITDAPQSSHEHSRLYVTLNPLSKDERSFVSLLRTYVKDFSALPQCSFICALCCHVLVSPVVSECAHKFCSACIRNFGERQCPLCQAAIGPPTVSWESLLDPQLCGLVDLYEPILTFLHFQSLISRYPTSIERLAGIYFPNNQEESRRLFVLRYELTCRVQAALDRGDSVDDLLPDKAPSKLKARRSKALPSKTVFQTPAPAALPAWNNSPLVTNDSNLADGIRFTQMVSLSSGNKEPAGRNNREQKAKRGRPLRR